MTTIEVNTKSNYNNCNGKKLIVNYFAGTIVNAQIPRYGFNDQGEAQGDYIAADFYLNEVIKINTHN